MKLSENYIQWIKDIRKSKELHGIVEDKLIQILSTLSSEFEPIKEPQGLAGGRNDLILFRFDGKKILFEIFGSKSQVSRDLRILDKTDASKKIAVIIDKKIDPGVIDKFLKENPENNYPYIFIGELFDQNLVENCKHKLKFIIYGDEESRFELLLRQKLSIANKNFIESLKDLNIELLSSEELETGSVSFRKVLITLILKKLKDLGLKKEKLLYILSWLSDSRTIHFLLQQLDHGLNAFLYTDCEEIIGFYSDVEITDFLRSGYQFSSPHLIFPMNLLIYKIFEDYRIGRLEIDREKCIRYTVGFSEIIEEKNGRVVRFGIPGNVTKIYVQLPFEEVNSYDSPQAYIDHYRDMIEFVDGKTLLVFRFNSFEPGFTHLSGESQMNANNEKTD